VSAQSVAVREAATVMLVRDAPGLEVFMLRRHPQSTFVPGAYVFPGGQVDADDGAPAIAARATGLEPGAADARLGVVGATRFWVAAVRETFEEAGVLVARAGHAGAPLGSRADHDALAVDRVDLLRGRTDLARVLARHDAVLDLAALVPFGRWITPRGAPKRFDTWFFVAAAPVGHAYAHDDDEMVASEWLRPDDALDRARAGDIELIYPTIRSLLVMRRFPTASAFLGAVRDRWERPDALRVMDPGAGWQLDLTSDDERAADDAASAFVVRMGRESPAAVVVDGGVTCPT
jgi:8-oxo-dGTP pyrophosphatase MutT (NUDIX family)